MVLYTGVPTMNETLQVITNNPISIVILIFSVCVGHDGMKKKKEGAFFTYCIEYIYLLYVSLMLIWHVITSFFGS